MFQIKPKQYFTKIADKIKAVGHSLPPRPMAVELVKHFLAMSLNVGLVIVAAYPSVVIG